MATKSGRKLTQKLLSFSDTPETIINRANQICNQYEQSIKELLADIKPENATIQNFLLPAAHLENEYFREAHLVQFYQFVSTDAALQEASRKASMIIKSRGGVWNRLLECFRAISSTPNETDLETRAFLGLEKKRGIHNGIDVTTGPIRDQVVIIDKERNQIQLDFQTNLRGEGVESTDIWLSETDLKGVPHESIQRLERGAGVNEGKLRIDLGVSILRYAADPDVRKWIYIAYENNCNDNVPLFKQLMILHHKRATLLGFPDHATFALDGTMLRDPEVVRGLLSRFGKRVSRNGLLEALTELKRLDPQATDKTLYTWDEPYYKRAFFLKNYSMDLKEIADYFPADSTIRGMFKIFEELFGLVFEQVEGDVWHKEVEIFAVWDQEESGGEFLGYIYLDIYLRPTKHDDCANFRLQPSFNSRSGERVCAVVALVCNFERPTPTRPGLLHHGDIATCFHELGHSIHALVSRNKHARFCGYMGTEDFTEVPGMMLEHWCWSAEQLKRLSRHFETGETIPDDLLDNLIRSRDISSAVLCNYQVAIATFDMAVHTPASQSEIEEMDIAQLYNRTLREIRGLKDAEDLGMGSNWGHGYTSLTRLVVDYPGSLYIYISSFCFSELIWKSIFAQDPMSKEAGMRFRRLVLEMGGTQDPMVMMENLLGERPDLSALCSDDS